MANKSGLIYLTGIPSQGLLQVVKIILRMALLTCKHCDKVQSRKSPISMVSLVDLDDEIPDIGSKPNLS